MSSAEDAFLTAIRAQPDDRLARLVYADWLAEQDDRRHELIRVCESMRQLPVFSDEYWRLKSQRNELRKLCSAEWLAATGYDGSWYDPIFRHGFPTGWRERWRLIREFTERWHGHPLVDVGGRQSEIGEVERRLGRQLSPSLREYVAYAHDVFPAPDRRTVHRDGYIMEWLPDQPALSLMIISEGNVNWAVHESDLVEDDPTVRVYYSDDHDETRYVPAPDGATEGSVTDFVMGFTEGYKPTCGRFASYVLHADLLREKLEAAFPVHRWSTPESGCYESASGILAGFRRDPWNPRRYLLSVDVHLGVSWQLVPSFLWDHARRKHMCCGIFLSQTDINMGLTHWGDGPYPEGFVTEAVPPMRIPETPEEFTFPLTVRRSTSFMCGYGRDCKSNSCKVFRFASLP